MEFLFDENAKQNDQTRQVFYEYVNILKHLQIGELEPGLLPEVINLFNRFS